MKVITGLVMLAVLASCGADGAPTRPTKNENTSVSQAGSWTKISISGDVRIGVTWREH